MTVDRVRRTLHARLAKRTPREPARSPRTETYATRRFAFRRTRRA